MACNNCNNQNYETSNTYTWCTNCGNYGINGALRRALSEEEIAPDKAVLCFDIGCNGNGSDKVNAYIFHGLHGRVIPFASGASCANSKIPVIASAGDGATLGEGINHYIYAIRSNYNVTFLLHNNSNYALTTGQASPTTPQGVTMNSSPEGVITQPLNVGLFTLALNPSFYARGYSGNIGQLTKLMRQGIKHRGFSVIEILQDCPTYNTSTPHDWFMKRIYSVDDLSSYDNTDIELAKTLATDLEERIATGLLYVNRDSVPYLDQLSHRQTFTTSLVEEVQSYDITNLIAEFR